MGALHQCHYKKVQPQERICFCYLALCNQSGPWTCWRHSQVRPLPELDCTSIVLATGVAVAPLHLSSEGLFSSDDEGGGDNGGDDDDDDNGDDDGGDDDDNNDSDNDE